MRVQGQNAYSHGHMHEACSSASGNRTYCWEDGCKTGRKNWTLLRFSRWCSGTFQLDWSLPTPKRLYRKTVFALALFFTGRPFHQDLCLTSFRRFMTGISLTCLHDWELVGFLRKKISGTFITEGRPCDLNAWKWHLNSLPCNFH